LPTAPSSGAASTQRFLPIHNAMVLLPALLQVIQQVIKRETDCSSSTSA
jgi:hypothetical protein